MIVINEQDVGYQDFSSDLCLAYENYVQIPFDKTLEEQRIHPNDILYGNSLLFLFTYSH